MISKWLWNRLTSEEVPYDLESVWRSLLEFCSGHPNWNGHPDADLASLWAHLIGIDSSAFRFWRAKHTGIANRAEALIESRLEVIVKGSSTAGPALRWMSRGAGGIYQLRALVWTSEAIHGFVDTTTGDGELALSIAEFLCHVWQDNQDRITTSPPLTFAFRRVLRATAGLGCDLAIDLEQRISDATQ